MRFYVLAYDNGPKVARGIISYHTVLVHTPLTHPRARSHGPRIRVYNSIRVIICISHETRATSAIIYSRGVTNYDAILLTSVKDGMYCISHLHTYIHFFLSFFLFHLHVGKYVMFCRAVECLLDTYSFIFKHTPVRVAGCRVLSDRS